MSRELPTTSVPPPPRSQLFGSAWKSEKVVPQDSICALHKACSCDRIAGSVVAELLRVVPVVGPGKNAARPVLLRHGSVGVRPMFELPLGVAYSSERFGARSARL